MTSISRGSSCSIVILSFSRPTPFSQGHHKVVCRPGWLLKRLDLDPSGMGLHISAIVSTCLCLAMGRPEVAPRREAVEAGEGLSEDREAVAAITAHMRTPALKGVPQVPYRIYALFMDDDASHACMWPHVGQRHVGILPVTTSPCSGSEWGSPGFGHTCVHTLAPLSQGGDTSARRRPGICRGRAVHTLPTLQCPRRGGRSPTPPCPGSGSLTCKGWDIG